MELQGIFDGLERKMQRQLSRRNEIDMLNEVNLAGVCLMQPAPVGIQSNTLTVKVKIYLQYIFILLIQVLAKRKFRPDDEHPSLLNCL